MSVAFAFASPIYTCTFVHNFKQFRNSLSFNSSKLIKTMNVCNFNSFAHNDESNILYVKRMAADGNYHTLNKVDPRSFQGGETLHEEALRFCKSALADNRIGDAVVVSLKKPLSGFEIAWFYDDELSVSMLRTLCNSAYEPEFGMDPEEVADDKEEEGNNGGASDL